MATLFALMQLNDNENKKKISDQEIKNVIAQDVRENTSSSSSSSSSNIEKLGHVEADEDDNGKGMFLTWEDLWVTVSDGRGSSKPILQGLTGYARPGELLAIMGPSGCGKSTLLDTLAGRLGSNTRHSGNILVNGTKQQLTYGTSAYVTQDDNLIATLTVREAVYYSAQLQLPNAMTLFEKRQRADATIRQMGLQDSLDTRIGGGWGAKGISSGQKRRVSICIELLTHPKLLFLDEPTSGLDSAASYHVMSRIASAGNGAGRTVITSIHQPSSEVFALFDNLCLLSSGKTVYFGPARSANGFFALNGYPCLTHYNPADFFLRTINKDFDEDIELGLSGRKTTEEVIEILANSYKVSSIYKENLSQVAKICKQREEVLNQRRTHASFITQCLVLTRRSFTNMSRDLGYYWFRLATYVVLAIFLGTIFFQLGPNYNSLRSRCSMLSFVVGFLTFLTIGGFSSFVEDMKVFERERLNGHYGAVAFVIGHAISSMPFVFLVAAFPGAIAYFLTGLRAGFEHYIYFALILSLCLMLGESLMMIIACVVSNYLTGMIASAAVLGYMILGGGFFRLPHELPWIFWKYPTYYISFHMYAFQGLYKNEFQGAVYKVGGLGTISGDYIMRDMWQVNLGFSKWVNLGIMVGMVVVYRLIFVVIVKSIEKVKPKLRALVFSISPKNDKKVMINPTKIP